MIENKSNLGEALNSTASNLENAANRSSWTEKSHYVHLFFSKNYEIETIYSKNFLSH